MYKIVLFTDDNFAASFSLLIPCVYFSCLTAMARISNTLLNSSVDKGHPLSCS